MTRGTGRRSALAAAVLAGVLAAASLSGVPAAAVPTHHATHRAGAVDTAKDAVLIVHTRASHQALHAGIAAAERSGAQLRHTFAGPHSFSVQVPAPGLAAETARLRRLPDVTGIEPSVTRHLFETVDDPDDPGFGRQETYLDAVDAPGAWAMQHGSRSVTVAVLDTGIDVTHPDLDSKIVGTYNASTGGSAVDDEIGHGTFVAGVAAAATDNGLGVAGAGWDTGILAVKVAADNGELPVDDEIAGIRWAVANGANIINLSLGGPDSSASERKAVEYAISKGVLVVAAAGNTGRKAKEYPAAYPGVVSVGATDPARGTRAGFSTHGSWVTLAAPGVGIYSTTPEAGSSDFPGTTGYASDDGTSFAAPLVAGEAALLEAQDPALGEQGVRAALISSAHGYQHLGLGAGQVDFAAALAGVAPSTKPYVVTSSGTSGDISASATSGAEKVAFRIDSGPLSSPVTVSQGAASTTLPTYGYANGTHTLQAYDCSSAGVCSSSPTDSLVPLVLSNSAPTITAPAADADVTGRFTVTATHSGGGGELLVDGRPTAFAATSPYMFTVDGSSLTDGTHTLSVELCSTDGTLCSGPSSTTQSVTNDSLHPTITSLSPATISPNGDGVDDSATLRFSLPDSEDVTVQTVDSAGQVVKKVALDTLDAGKHTFTWDGTRTNGERLPDGDYVLELDTSVDNEQVRGYAARSGAVDTHAPTLTHVRGGGRTFYPVHDGYRDTFAPSARLGGDGYLSLVVTDSRGHVVRTLGGYRHPGNVTLSWNGRNERGRRVAAGHYRWRYSVTDEAGNTRRSSVREVTVSSQRLEHQTVQLRRAGARTRHARGTKRSCASARQHPSAFRHGILLVNGCTPSSGDLAVASYRFTIPHALSYGRLQVSVDGRSTHRPSQLTAAIRRTDGGLDVQHYARISRRGTHWMRIVSTPLTDHLTHKHSLYLSIVLTSAYAGQNDYDLKWVRLRVRVTRLG